MDKQNNKIYFPLFYKYAALLASLSKEELGELVYAILLSEGSPLPKEPLSNTIEAIYKLMIADASLLFEKNRDKSCSRKEHEYAAKKQAAKPRYGDFDVNEAFQKALRRSYED